MLNILQKNIIKSRNVNTWSSLAKAFNAKTIEKFDITSTTKHNVRLFY